jgi:hypothetical protein
MVEMDKAKLAVFHCFVGCFDGPCILLRTRYGRHPLTLGYYGHIKINLGVQPASISFQVRQRDIELLTCVH